MITDRIRMFIEKMPLAFVASANEAGEPHLAVARGVLAPDPEHLVFENWLCPTTLRNVDRNPRVAVAVTSPEGESGYQFIGRVTRTIEAAIVDGYVPGSEYARFPQALIRLVIDVEKVMEFSVKLHSDASATE